MMMQDDLAAANALFLDERYQEALELYNSAILKHPQDHVALDKRAALKLKLNQPQEALEDAERALQIQPNSNTAFLRKGQALFGLEKYAEANECFLQAKKLGMDSAADLWIEKTSAKLPAVQNKPAPLADNLKYAWVQTNDSVSITYYAKNVDPKNIQVEFHAKKVSVKIVLQDSSVYQSDIELFAEINTNASSFKSTPYKVIIEIRKKDAMHWDDLFNKRKSKLNLVSIIY
jgi:tetratricopeptide (TPR) repeat protein